MSLVVSKKQYCRQYHNQFRAAFTLKGEAHQVYLDDRAEAEMLQYLMRKAARSELLPMTSQTVKKRNAHLSKDLPVGVSVMQPKGKSKNPSLVYNFRHPYTKKPIGMSVAFGEDLWLGKGVRGSRTKAEALKMLTEKANKYARIHFPHIFKAE